jgi:glucosamine-6-phosphate deaminase
MMRMQIENLPVYVGHDDQQIAEQAVEDFVGFACALLARTPELNVVFAGAESQMTFHRALASRTDIPWNRIHAFAVDDFWSPGLPEACAVAAEPKRELYANVQPASVNVIDPCAADADAEARRYETLIRAQPPHIACIGIGCSGHLALNEPGDTDFHDPRWVRVVDVCEASKRQLEADPNFMRLPAIPERGITMTVPAILEAEHILVLVPYAIKAPIVKRFFESPVTPTLPATVLKQHPGARLYLDQDSFRDASRLACFNIDP